MVANTATQSRHVKPQLSFNIVSQVFIAAWWGIWVLTGWLGYLWWSDDYMNAVNAALNQKEALVLKVKWIVAQNTILSAVNKSIFIQTFTQFQAECSHLFNVCHGSDKTWIAFKTYSLLNHWQQIKLFITQMISLICIVLAVIGLKLFMLILALPLFLMAAWIGLADGLMLRAIRTASLGRESAYLFHQLAKYSLKFFFAGMLLFMVLPITNHLSASLLLLATGIGIGISQVVSRFKKYI